MREALEAHGVAGELLLIGDGDKAIRYIEGLNKERCPDLFIIDLNLPKRPGSEVLQSMAQSKSCRDAVVVILSSSDMQQDKAEAIGLGASRYIRKPLRLEDFLALGAVFRAILETSGK